MTPKPPILLIHGMWSRPWVWGAWRSLLEGAGYACTAVTLPGHGANAGTPPPAGLGRLGMADYVAHVARAVRACAAPPIVIGHSMGGLIAQQVATQMPLHAVVGVNAAAPGTIFPLRLGALPGTARHFANPLLWRSAFRLNAWEAQYLLFNALPDAQAKDFAAQLVHESGRVAYQLGFGPLNVARSNRVDKSAVKAPLLLLSGARDRIVPLAASRATAKWYGAQAVYREYPAHAHWLLEEPGYETVVADMLAWLERL